MKLAILGLDEEVTASLATAIELGSVDAHFAVLSPVQIETIRRWAPQVRLVDDWETVLAEKRIDAVLVARDESPAVQEEKLRRIAQSAIPLIVSHPGCSAIVAYELDMIASDTGGRIAPLYPGDGHPLLALARRMIDAGTDGPLGVVQRVELERRLPEASEEAVRQALALDVAVLRQLIGPVTSVSAIGSLAGSGGGSGMTVHLATERPLEARWSLIPSGQARIRLIGDLGECQIQIEGDPRGWRVEGLPAHSESEWLEWSEWNPLEAALEALEDPSRAAWQAACHDLEVAEMAFVSLRKKRTLDVYGDPPTEEDAFKGFMAMGSCLLLLLALLLFCVLAVTEGIRLAAIDPTEITTELGAEEETGRNRWPLLLRFWPVYPLLAFLGLQFLLVVARRPRR